MDNPRSGKKEIGIFFVLCLLLSGCATVDVPNAGESGYKVEQDEARMIKRAAEVDEVLEASDIVYSNLDLENYLTKFANDLLPDSAREAGIKISIKVLRDPTPNAMAFPNGRIYVHIGILSVIENEAQLASLLGHEMTHVVHRHQLKSFRSLTNKSAFLSAIIVPMTVVGGNAGALVTQLGIVSSAYGYSQSLEQEADEGGFKMALDRGYDVSEAPKLFEHLDEFLKAEEIKEPFFFSDHPKVKARIANFRKLVDESHFNDNAQNKLVNTGEYEKFHRAILLEEIQLCFQQGFFKTAESTIDHLIKVEPKLKDGYFLRGELYRQRQDHEKKEKTRDKKGDYPKAIEAYDAALAIEPNYADAVKGKARIIQKQGDLAQAKTLYQQYLQLNPNADDKAFIEQFISSH